MKQEQPENPGGGARDPRPDPASRRSRLLLAGAGLLVISLAVAAVGTTIALKNRRPPPPPAAEAAAQFVAKIMAFRSLMLDERQAGALPGDDQRRLAELYQGELAEQAPRAWRYFFTGSIVFAGALASPQPVTAFYNPWTDTAVLIKWTSADWNAPSILAATAWTGAGFLAAAEPGEEAPPWMEKSRTRAMPLVLRDQVHAFGEAFFRRFPPASAADIPLPENPRAAQTRDLAIRRSGYLLLQLIACLRPERPQFNPLLAELRQALATGDWSAVTARQTAACTFDPADLAVVPPDRLRNLAPYVAVADDKVAIAYCIAPDLPHQFLLARLITKPKPQVASIQFVNVELP